MHLTFKILIMFTLLLFAVNDSYTQTDKENLSECEKWLVPPFISDGQNYLFEIDNEQKGNLRKTFFGGTTYRIIICSENREKATFSMYDTEKNLLFTNQNHNNAGHWDFRFESTIDCIIEVKSNTEKTGKSKVKLLIGFKN